LEQATLKTHLTGESMSESSNTSQSSNNFQDFIRGEYRPPQRELYDKLILGVESPERIVWHVYRLSKTKILADGSVTEGDIQTCANPKVVEHWLNIGYNVMFLEHRADLNMYSELINVVKDHFESFLQQQDARKHK
jgi:hypothetical protein